MRTNSSTLLKTLATTSTNNSVRSFAPIIAQTMEPEAWMHDVINTVTPEYGRDGRLLKHKRKALSVMWQAPWAVTQLTKEMYCAQRMGLVGYADAVGKLNKLRGLVEAAQGIIHSELEFMDTNNQVMDIPPTVAIHASVRSEHANPEGDGVQMGDELDQLIAEQAADDEFNAETSAQAEFVLQEWETARYMREAKDNGLRSSKDSISPDEGWLDVALHDPNQLFQYDPQDIRGMRGMMMKVLVRALDLKLPMEHPMYESLLTRLAESWAAAKAYFPQTALKELREEGIKFPTSAQIAERVKKMEEVHDKKCAKRALILQGGLLAEPTEDMQMAVGTYDRWAVNHATRRIWRDMATLSKLRVRIEQQHDDCLRMELEEERSGKPKPRWARSLATEEGLSFGEDDSRTWFLAGWAEVTESEALTREVDAGHAHIGYNSGVSQMLSLNSQGEETRTGMIREHSRAESIKMSFTTAGERERAILTRVGERIDQTMEGLKSLYKEMRKLDKAIGPVWKALHVPADKLKKDQPLMPEKPPVYWNLQGFYEDQTVAKEALDNESKEVDFKVLEACGDRAGSRFKAMLAGAKFDI